MRVPLLCSNWRMKTPSYWRRTPNCSVRKPQIMRAVYHCCVMHRWYKAQNLTSPSDAFLSTWLVQECWLSYCKISICHVYCAHHKMISLCALGWIPYSRELLREKTFVNWWKIWFSRRKLSQIACFYRAKGCHAPKFYRENFCKYPQNCEIHESFLPRKFPTIRYILTRNVFGPSVATLSCARRQRKFMSFCVLCH